MDHFVEQANKFHPIIKFTAEISENEITFVDTMVFKGKRLKNESILDIKTHYKPTETFQNTHFNSWHPPNSSKIAFEESLVKLKQHLRTRGYPKTVTEGSLSGVNFAARPSALTKKKKANERISTFFTTYHPEVNNLKQTQMEQWSLIQNRPLLITIYLKPPIVSYNRSKSLKDTLVRSKKWEVRLAYWTSITPSTSTTNVVCGLSFSRSQPDFDGFLRVLRFPPSSKLTPSLLSGLHLN